MLAVLQKNKGTAVRVWDNVSGKNVLNTKFQTANARVSY